jgi:DDE superfamily endonuclease
MTKHNLRMLDLYTDYLLSSFGATTATGLARLVPEVSHDQITRFLSQAALTDKDLWKLIKKEVRQIESPDAVLILDDCVEEKPYTDESELVTWHYDHSKGRTVKGINLLSALYFSREVSLPVGFELIQKTLLTTDPKTGKDKWVAPRTKNELARDLIQRTVHKQIPFRFVLADIWFASAENMVFIKQKAKKDFIMPLKRNRRVALSESDRNKGRWKSLTSLEIKAGASVTLYLEGVPFPLLVVREVFINEDGTEGALLLACSDTSLSASALFPIYQKRWKVEEYHKSLKQNAALAKSPTKLPHTQQNHIFASLMAFCKIELLRTQTDLNHFALKAKLYQAALSSAFEQLKRFKDRCSLTPYHTLTA